MFLPLSSTIAGGRALFALTVTAVSAAGHGHVTGVPLDVPSFLLAMLLLIGVSWTTRHPLLLLGAAMASQLLVHIGGGHSGGHALHTAGSAAVQGPTLPMIAVHALATVAAWLLLWQFESLWAAVTACSRRLISAFTMSPAAVPVVRTLLPAASVVGRAARFVGADHFRRGPPVFA